MSLYASPNGLAFARFAASVSSKTANAVGRNRLKRLAKETFRLNQEKARSGFDYLLIFHKGLKDGKTFKIKELILENVSKLLLSAMDEVHKKIDEKN